ncbi:MAG: uncharacterized protein PWP04_661 [Candidatus Atribacteria bacterium]|nr:uncharacterized protein [Candidatus Atribacteria bacterium]
MNTIFQELKTIQKLDKEINYLQQQITKKEAEINSLQKKEEVILQKMSQLKKKLETEKINLANLELELKESEGKLSKAKNKLYSGDLSSPKELSQWEKSLDQMEKGQKLIEDKVLEQMETVEKMEKERPEKKQQLEQQQVEIKTKVEKLKKETKKQKTQLEKNVNFRNDLMKNIPADLKSLYQDLKQRLSDPVTFLIDETCEGCHLQVPTIVVKKVRRKEEIVQCPNCGRFLLPEEKP